MIEKIECCLNTLAENVLRDKINELIDHLNQDKVCPMCDKKTDDCVGSSFVERKVEEFTKQFCNDDGYLIIAEIGSYKDSCDYLKNFIRQALQEQAEDIMKCIPKEPFLRGATNYSDKLITNLKNKGYALQ